MKNLFIILTMFFISIIISCKEPPEEKLVGKWKIEKAYVDDVDQSAKLDTMHILYYTFSIEEVNWNIVSITVDTNIAKWQSAECCKYNFSKGGYFNWQRIERTLRFPPAIVDKCTATGLLIGPNENYCRTDLFFPMFIAGDYETWKIKKRRKNQLHLELRKNEKEYNVHLKRIEE